MTKEQLHEIYAVCGADALFLEQDFLRRYVTGFYSTDGYVVYDGEVCTFVADARYFEAAQNALAGSFVAVKEGTYAAAMELVRGKKTLGAPFPYISRAASDRLEGEGFALVDCMPALRTAMKVKSEAEISLIGQACDIAEEGFLATLPRVKEGMTERELAAVLEYEMRMRGAEGVSFETIVAFGAGSSVPHHETGDTKLRFGDVVLIDYGCKKGGYCSDCTRTFLFGDDGIARQPRTFAFHGGKAYVCNFDGTVVRIDTATLAVDGITQAGRNPDGICCAAGKLYVSNSGGLDPQQPDNTVSVIDIASFITCQLGPDLA